MTSLNCSTSEYPFISHDPSMPINEEIKPKRHLTQIGKRLRANSTPLIEIMTTDDIVHAWNPKTIYKCVDSFLTQEKMSKTNVSSGTFIYNSFSDDLINNYAIAKIVDLR